MKKPKPKPFIAMGQHAAGPGFDYARHIYSDGRVVEKIKGKVPKRFLSTLNIGEQGESDATGKTTKATYAKALKRLIKRTKRR